MSGLRIEIGDGLRVGFVGANCTAHIWWDACPSISVTAHARRGYSLFDIAGGLSGAEAQARRIDAMERIASASVRFASPELLAEARAKAAELRETIARVRAAQVGAA